MAFPPFTQISPTTGVDLDRLTLPQMVIASVGPFLTFDIAGAVDGRYVLLANGPADGVWDSWPVLGGAPATPFYAHMMKSADGGLTWAEQDAAAPERPELPPVNGNDIVATNGWISFQCVHDTAADIIYVAHFIWDYVNYASASAYRLAIARFDLVTDTWLAPLTGYGDANAPEVQKWQSGWSPHQPFAFARRPVDGHMFVWYNRWENVLGSLRAGNNYDHCYMSEYVPGVGWSVAVKFAGAALEDNDYNPYGAVVGKDERLHCFMFQYDPPDGIGTSACKMYSRSLSNLDVLDALAMAVDSTPDLDNRGREFAVTTPRTRTVGSETEILLGMIIQPGAMGPRYWRSYRGNSAANLTTASFTPEQVSNVAADFWSFPSLSNGGFGVDDNNDWYGFSWGSNEYFNQWRNSGAGWGAPSQLYDDLAFLNGGLNVGSESGLIGVFSAFGPTGFVFWDEVWYWELGAAAPPGPGPAPAGGVPGIGGSGGGSGVCRPLNRYDLCLDGILGLTKRWFELHEPPGKIAPWVEMPNDGRRFQRVGSIVLPADDGANHLMLRFRVGQGYDGVIMTITAVFAGLGFIPGNGDLHWRVRTNYNYLKDQGDIITNRSRLRNPYPLEGGGYRIHSNETIRMYVNVAPGAAARLQPGARIVCGLSGWFYPVGRSMEGYYGAEKMVSHRGTTPRLAAGM